MTTLIERDEAERFAEALTDYWLALLNDLPATLTREVYALHRSGAPIEEAEKVMYEMISVQLDAVKNEMLRSVEDDELLQ